MVEDGRERVRLEFDVTVCRERFPGGLCYLHLWNLSYSNQ